MRIDVTPDHLLTAANRRHINELSDIVYPTATHYPGTMRIRWAPQTIRAMVWDDDERLVCHVGALIRSALIDGKSVQVGGIAGVMTAPDVRRSGHGTAALEAMRHYLITDQKVAFSLLFCAADLYHFYEKRGWRLLETTPIIDQAAVPVEFALNRAMVQDGNEAAPTNGALNLQGPPW